MLLNQSFKQPFQSWTKFISKKLVKITRWKLPGFFWNAHFYQECAFFYLNGVYNAEIEYFLHINSIFFGLVTFTWLIIIIIIIMQTCIKEFLEFFILLNFIVAFSSNVDIHTTQYSHLHSQQGCAVKLQPYIK